MTWGIIGALDAEIALICKEMNLRKAEDVYGSTYYCGDIYGHEVIAVCSSIGTINAAVCTSTLIREFGANKVVNVGIAGSATRELGIMDVIVAEDLVFHDADLDILVKYYPFRASFITDEKLRKLAVDAIQELPERSFRWKLGRIASGDTFVNDSACKAQIINKCAPLCIEMEGAAIAQVAYMNQTPFLVIRTLSDNADESADETYDNFLDRAAQNSAQIFLKMLQLHR